jgi:opacity protein-like surface antigen
MKKLSGLIAAVILLACAGSVSAQKHEVSLLVGGMKTGDKDVVSPLPGNIQIGWGVTYQVGYSQRLLNARLASLYVDFPLTVTPTRDIKSPSNPLSPSSYSSIFFTPGVKLKLTPPASPLTPYAVAGVGFAHFGSSSTLVGGQQNPGSTGATHGVFDFGGGVDVRLIPFVSLRGEVRDYVSGSPNFNLQVIGGRQNNVTVAGGIVLRF